RLVSSDCKNRELQRNRLVFVATPYFHKRAPRGKTLRLAQLCRIHRPDSSKAIANPHVLTTFCRAL
ncbi:hypothetical protein, partial [Acinetobacter baumannii]|uniref:hypothetical protein n=1 Tax=Acinetobacter baumannii TaxID=470 RepID=UPI0033999663